MLLAKRFIVPFILISGFCSVANLYAQQDPLTFIKTGLGESAFNNASLSFLAIDAESGEVLSAFDQNRSLVCASVMKLFSSAAALEHYGSDHQFETKISYCGSISDQGELDGNLIIKTCGDPALGSERFQEHYGDWLSMWVQRIKSTGITSINGNVLIDESYFQGETHPRNWVWADLGNYYGASAGSAVVFDNSVKLYFETSNEIGGKTKLLRTEPVIPGLIYNNEVISSTGGDNAYIFGGPSDYQREIRGTLPKGRSSFRIKGSIPEPGKYLAYLVDSALKANDVSVQSNSLDYADNCSDSTTLIFIQKSPALKDIVKTTIEESVNLYAEAFLLHLKRDYLAPDDQSVLNSFWSDKIETNGMFNDDGSGLSRYNAVSAENLCNLLYYIMKESSYSDVFESSLAVAGKTGTLKYFGRSAPLLGNFKGKSGSMNRVYSYAGIMKTSSGKEIILAAVLNNYDCKSSEARGFIDSLFRACFYHL